MKKTQTLVIINNKQQMGLMGGFSDSWFSAKPMTTAVQLALDGAVWCLLSSACSWEAEMHPQLLHTQVSHVM